MNKILNYYIKDFLMNEQLSRLSTTKCTAQSRGYDILLDGSWQCDPLLHTMHSNSIFPLGCGVAGGVTWGEGARDFHPPLLVLAVHHRSPMYPLVPPGVVLGR